MEAKSDSLVNGGDSQTLMGSTPTPKRKTSRRRRGRSDVERDVQLLVAVLDVECHCWADVVRISDVDISPHAARVAVKRLLARAETEHVPGTGVDMVPQAKAKVATWRQGRPKKKRTITMGQ